MVEAGADSVEHGNYQNEESILCMSSHDVVWVPTVVTVYNLIGCGRFRDELLEKIWSTQKWGLIHGWKAGVQMALGSDAGAFMVPHGVGIRDEYQAFCRVLGESEALTRHLRQGEEKIRRFRPDH